MDFLNIFFGRDNRRNDLTGMVGSLSKWIISCGCLLIAAVVAGIVLLLAGIISFGEDAVNNAIVFVTIIVALVSLLRTGLD